MKIPRVEKEKTFLWESSENPFATSKSKESKKLIKFKFKEASPECCVKIY